MAKGMSVYERLTGGSRKQRKELQRRLYVDDPGLGVVHANAAGIDIGNESHFVAVPAGRDAERVREFGSWTADLERMAAWLKSCGIETVAMQSTGVYWFAAYDVLEKHGLKVFLVNASHTKNLPGRKSDVQESQWLMKLHTYGLLRNSFRPPEEIRPIRAVWRLRDRHVEEAARSIQHMQKSLTSMNVQLANASSDISGVSGQAIIRSILAGERDARELARLRDRRIKASEEEVARSLEGNWQEDQLFELQQAVDEYDFRQKQITECDQKLQTYLAVLPSRPAPAADTGTVMPPPSAPGKKKKRAKKVGGGNTPQSFDLAAELKRITGVDAIRIEGVNLMTIQTVVAELGTELGNWWPTEQHFASWLGLSPKRDVSEWRPSRCCAATAIWVRATGISGQGLEPLKQSRQWHATWLVSSTASSPKARLGWIAELNSSSGTAQRAIWPDFRLRPTQADSASSPQRSKSHERSMASHKTGVSFWRVRAWAIRPRGSRPRSLRTSG